MADEVGSSFLVSGWNLADSYGDYYCLCDQSKSQNEVNSTRPTDTFLPIPKRSLGGSWEEDGGGAKFIDRCPKGLKIEKLDCWFWFVVVLDRVVHSPCFFYNCCFAHFVQTRLFDSSGPALSGLLRLDHAFWLFTFYLAFSSSFLEYFCSKSQRAWKPIKFNTAEKAPTHKKMHAK